MMPWLKSLTVFGVGFAYVDVMLSVQSVVVLSSVKKSTKALDVQVAFILFYFILCVWVFWLKVCMCNTHCLVPEEAGRA